MAKARVQVTLELLERALFPPGVKIITACMNPDAFIDGKHELMMIIEGGDIPGATDVEGAVPPLVAPVYEGSASAPLLASQFRGWV